MSDFLKQKIDESGELGRSMIIQMEGDDLDTTSGARFFGIKISDFYFGVLLDE